MSSQENLSALLHLDDNMMQELQEVMAGDFNLLLETFLNDSKNRLNHLKEAVLKQEAEEVRRQAHSFKGSAGNVGAAKLSQLCKILEDMGRAGGVSQAQEIYDQIQEELALVEVEMQKYFQP